MIVISASVCLSVAPAVAQSARFQCFGNEPFWDLTLTAGWARLKQADHANRDFGGKIEERDYAKTTHWRGKGAAGELIVFVEQRACSDGMSEDEHAYRAFVSTGPGQSLLGCCRLPR